MSTTVSASGQLQFQYAATNCGIEMFVWVELSAVQMLRVGADLFDPTPLDCSFSGSANLVDLLSLLTLMTAARLILSDAKSVPVLEPAGGGVAMSNVGIVGSVAVVSTSASVLAVISIAFHVFQNSSIFSFSATKVLAIDEFAPSAIPGGRAIGAVFAL